MAKSEDETLGGPGSNMLIALLTHLTADLQLVFVSILGLIEHCFGRYNQPVIMFKVQS